MGGFYKITSNLMGIFDKLIFTRQPCNFFFSPSFKHFELCLIGRDKMGSTRGHLFPFFFYIFFYAIEYLKYISDIRSSPILPFGLFNFFFNNKSTIC